MANQILLLSQLIDTTQTLLQEVTLKYNDLLNSTAKLDTELLSRTNSIYETITTIRQELDDINELFIPEDWDIDEATDNIWLQDRIDQLNARIKQLKKISPAFLYKTNFESSFFIRSFNKLLPNIRMDPRFNDRGYYYVYQDLPQTTSFTKGGIQTSVTLLQQLFGNIEELSPKRKKLLLISYARRAKDDDFLKIISYDLIKTLRATSYEDCLVWLWQQNARDCYDSLYGTMFFYDLLHLFIRNDQQKIFYRGVNNPSENYIENRSILSASNSRQVAINFATKKSNSIVITDTPKGVVYEILPDYYLDLKASGYGVVDNEEEVLVLNWRIIDKVEVSEEDNNER